jgi:hypothetical protein
MSQSGCVGVRGRLSETENGESGAKGEQQNAYPFLLLRFWRLEGIELEPALLNPLVQPLVNYKKMGRNGGWGEGQRGRARKMRVQAGVVECRE